MTRQDFTDAVAEVLGIHAMEWRVETIVRLADAYRANGRRITMRDDTLPHQIRLTFRRPNHQIAVSCACLALADGRNGITENYEPIEMRSRWDADEALAVWHNHVLEAGRG